MAVGCGGAVCNAVSSGRQCAILNLAFGTVPLSLDQWLTCLGMASLVLVYSELRKLVTRVAVGALAHRQAATET